MSLLSLRKEVDSFPNAWNFEKKLAEFKKAGNLYFTLGVYLKPFLQDATSGNFAKRVFYYIGEYYFIQELEKKHIQVLLDKLNAENVDTHYLFLDNSSVAKLGFSIKNNQIAKATSSLLSMINKLLQTTQDTEKLALLLEQTSLGKEKYVFLRIRTVKKLLASKFSNMLLKWLLGSQDKSL